MKPDKVIGIDIGGTGTKFGIVSRDGRILEQKNISTCDTDDVEDFAERLQAAIEPWLEGRRDEFAGIGMGAPNANIYRGTIEQAPNLKWKGVVPIRDIVQRRLKLPVIVTNDANAAAMGEMIFGAAKGMKNFIVITLGTGFGSGIVVDGEVLYGSTGFAGELGHVTVIRDGRSCGCGRKGCLEAYVSATGICRTVREWLTEGDLAVGDVQKQELVYMTKISELRVAEEKGELSSRGIREAAGRGDKMALRVFDFTARLLGEALADFTVFSSPEAIIAFGGLAQSGAMLLNPTRRYFEEKVLNVFKEALRSNRPLYRRAMPPYLAPPLWLGKRMASARGPRENAPRENAPRENAPREN